MFAFAIRRALPFRAGRLTAALLSGAILVCAAPSAGAASRPTVSQVQRQLAKLISLEDQAIQQYDQAVQELAAARRRLAVINVGVSRNRAQLQRMHAKIAQIAAAAYESGSLTSVGALLTDPNPQVAFSRASILQHLSTSQRSQMRAVAAAARQYAVAQRSARGAEVAIAALERQRLAQRKAITAEVAKQKALLAQLTAQQQAALSQGATISGTYTGPTTTQADKAVAFAYAQLGKPYVWGATGPESYDCSGLAQAAWASGGISIPRTTYEQWGALPHVSMSAIRPGDLIFFDSVGHVAIYVGNNMIIDAPQPGEYVEKISLSSSWYAASLDGAARP